MKILILTPQTFHQSWPVQNDFVKNICKIPPLSNAILKASVSDSHEVTIYDAANRPLSRRDYLGMLDAHDVVAISAYTPFSSFNNEITLKIIKTRTPDKPVVMGGHHATFYDAEWVKRGVDVVVRREGEKTFPEVIDALEKNAGLEMIEGITFNKDGQAHRTKDRVPMKTLDESVFPDFEPLKKFGYDFLAGPARFIGPVETSRGCPFKCSFCWVSPFWGARQRFKSEDRIIEELKTLDRLGADQTAFVDDNFASKPSFYGNLFERIVSEKLDKPSFVFLRVDTIIEHKKLIELGAKAGIKVAYIGFESLDDQALEDFDKRHRHGEVLAKAKEAYNRISKLGIFSIGLFVTGFPGHEKSDIYSIKRAHKVCSVVAPVMYMPFIGTSGYERLQETGAIVRDCFYHDRRLPSFQISTRTQQNRVMWYYLASEMSFRFFLKVLKGTDIQKYYVRQQLRCAIKALFKNFGFRHLMTTIVLALPWGDLNVKLRFLKKQYLSSTFIRRLAGK